MDEVPPNNEKDSQPIIIKKNVGWIVSFWIVLVCAGIALAVLGVKLADTQASYYKLQKDHSILQSAKSYVDSQNNKLSAEIASLKSENSKLQKQINGMSTGLYDAIYSFNSGKYYSDFHASTDIMVVKVGQKKTLDIYLNHYETTCDWEWTNGLICESECGEWNDNMTFPVYIIAKNAGTTVFTFKNSYNKETFNVLVVVVE